MEDTLRLELEVITTATVTVIAIDSDKKIESVCGRSVKSSEEIVASSSEKRSALNRSRSHRVQRKIAALQDFLQVAGVPNKSVRLDVKTSGRLAGFPV
jgi:hypothetical protein